MRPTARAARRARVTRMELCPLLVSLSRYLAATPYSIRIDRCGSPRTARGDFLAARSQGTPAREVRGRTESRFLWLPPSSSPAPPYEEPEKGELESLEALKAKVGRALSGCPRAESRGAREQRHCAAHRLAGGARARGERLGVRETGSSIQGIRFSAALPAGGQGAGIRVGSKSHPSGRIRPWGAARAPQR